MNTTMRIEDPNKLNIQGKTLIVEEEVSDAGNMELFVYRF